MKQSLISRGLLILALLGVAIFLVVPPKEKLKLGLDLKGGMHLVLEVTTDDALKAETDHDLDLLRQQLEKEGVLGGTYRRLGDQGADLTRFEVAGLPAGSSAKLESVYDEFLSVRWEMNPGSAGGTFALRDAARDEIRNQTIDQALRTIRNRIDQFGVTEPVIQRQGFGESDRLILQLPGVEDPERVKNLIKNTAFLEFRLAVAPREGGTAPSRDAVLGFFGGQLPADVEILEQPEWDATGKLVRSSWIAVEKRAVVTGRDLKTARESRGEFNEPVVDFILTYEKGEEFADMTAANVGRGMAVVLDKKVLTAPVIQSQIRDRGVIKGSFTPEEARDLATSLRSGALPAGIVVLEERTVGPALGQDSIDQGLRAGLYGSALVVLALIVVYLLSSVNAIVALALNVVFIFGALAAFSATLTLPGIAGIVLTIGMAVDANVLIFERIREELRAGRTVRAAVAAGFEKAFSSIVDSNVTTLLAALFLFQFGTGPIKGFAVTLSIGIASSMFTAIFVSRWLFDLWFAQKQRVERLSI